MSTEVFSRMAWKPFSLVSWVSLLRVVGLVKSSGETVRRSCSWMSWIVRALMKTVSVTVESEDQLGRVVTSGEGESVED